MSVHAVAHNPILEESRRFGEELPRLAGQSNVLHARLSAICAQALVSGSWGGHGMRSPAHWLAWQTGMSLRRARQIVTIASRRWELPVTMAAFDTGQLSVDHVLAIARRADACHDAEVCGLARSMSADQLQLVLSRYAHAPEPTAGPPADDAADAADADDEVAPEDAAADAADESASESGTPDGGAVGSPEPPQFAHDVTGELRAQQEAARRSGVLAPGSVNFGTTVNGRWYLHADLSPEAGQLVELALREARDRLFDGELGVRVTWRDALLDVVARAMTVTTPARQARYRAYVHLDVEGQWVQNGPSIPPALLDELLCDGEVQPVWTKGGVPVNVGRVTRNIPEHTRRLVLDRDGGCVVPMCRSTIGLEVHHVQHWEDGGRTDTSNLATECKAHHRDTHRGELSITGNADVPGGLVFHDRYGRPLIDHTAPVPPTEPPPDAVEPYQHPLDASFDHDCIVLSPRRDAA